MPSTAAVAWRRAMRKKAGRGRSAQKAGFRAVLFLGLLAVVMTYGWLAAMAGASGDDAYRTGHRRLANATDECEDVIGGGIDDSAPVVAFIIWVVIMLWVFLGIAVVCDEHFEGSLEVICDQLELSTAVGGATFMAAGSSAPELATSLVAVFTTRDATGLGTILGSAVFNLVAIICLSGIFGAGPYYKLTSGNDPTGEKDFAKNLGFTKALKDINDALPENKQVSTDGLFLDKRPLARDAFFYVIALAMCVLFALTPVGDGWCVSDANPDGIKSTDDPVYDHSVCQFNNKPGFVWWEGLILSLCYGIYIHSMIVDEELMKWMAEKAPHPPHIKAYIDAIDEKQDQEDADDEAEMSPDAEDGLAAPPATAAAVPTGGATEAEVGSLLADDPTAEPAPPPPLGAAAAPEQVGVEVIEVAEEDMKNVENYSTKKLQVEVKELKEHIQKLEERLNTVAEHGHDPKGKWEYMAKEEEEEESDFMGKIVECAQKPWELAFSATIPSCERDDYQSWDEDNPIEFKDIPRLYQKQIAKKAAREGEEEPEDDDIYFKGNHKRARVDLWYNQSKRYSLSFTMCIIWIGITSWAMVSLAAKMGCHLGVGSFSMGLVVLAAGTSIPDALSSIVVAKEGDGDMACANAVGSNVFNIFLGIGLPMMLSEWTWGDPFVVPDGLPVTISTLMLILITITMVRIICVATRLLMRCDASSMLPVSQLASSTNPDLCLFAVCLCVCVLRVHDIDGTSARA
jgi:Ca2+/Na+ antiporter